MTRFPCPYLHDDVEITEERELHLAERHPDLWPDHRERIADTLADPDQVRLYGRFPNTRLFSRWFTSVKGGKYVVAVVVTDIGPLTRHWLVSAYIARRLGKGEEVEWQRS